MQVARIAELIGCAWEGDGTLEITGAAPIEEAGPTEMSFVGSRKAAAAAPQSRAGCLIVTEGHPAGRTLIRAADPRGALAAAIALLYPRRVPASGVHSTAVVAGDAEIGDGVSIGPHASIGPGAQIGDGTVIGAGCAIGGRVKIGRRCLLHAVVTCYDDVTIGDEVVLHSGCVIGADGFGFVRTGDRYEKFPQIGRVEIGDRVEIGANSCVDRAALGVTRIGDGTKLDNMVHIAHNCRIGRNVVIAAQTGLSGGVVVEDDAVIGGQVGIGDKARIESGAVLGSGCGILTSKIVRKGQVVWGTPARPLREHLEQLANLARLPRMREEIEELKQELKRG